MGMDMMSELVNDQEFMYSFKMMVCPSNCTNAQPPQDPSQCEASSDCTVQTFGIKLLAQFNNGVGGVPGDWTPHSRCPRQCRCDCACGSPPRLGHASVRDDVPNTDR